MRMKPGRAAIVSSVAVLLLTSVYSLIPLPAPMTREQAIEVSKTSELVRDGLRVARSFTVETHYYNTSQLEELEKWHSTPIFKNVPKSAFWEGKVPAGHSAWEVLWWFSGFGAPSEGYVVIVIVDAEKREIIHQEKGIHLL